MIAQFITSPTGERLVVLAEEDYQALVEAAEDAEDVAAVRRFNERLASGEEELLPAEMVDRILDGENPIRVWREHRGLSVKALAEKAGIAPAYLSQVETGKRDGTVETLKKLAGALGATLDDLASEGDSVRSPIGVKIGIRCRSKRAEESRSPSVDWRREGSGIRNSPRRA